MWLLNAITRELCDFISEDEAPPYAILSHTWGRDEVRLQEWQPVPPPEIQRRLGYLKINYCCQQALSDGIGWVWVDTCCIDKTSSAELSEAINSMFRWYQNAKVCYAYLSDISRNTDLPDWEVELSQTYWLTRGWTLQELLAPKLVIFYSRDWVKIGDKESLSEVLSKATSIEEKYLLGADLGSASISKRMSWVSRRNTSRKEDIAYCLLGLFDVNMPLIYGEGIKAFKRLQEEIMRRYPLDQTLFAWGTLVTQPPLVDSTDNEFYTLGTFSSEPGPPFPLFGLLADHPREFEESGAFVPMFDTAEFYHFEYDETDRRLAQGSAFPMILGMEIALDLPVETGSALHRWEAPQIVTICRTRSALLLCINTDHPEKRVELPMLVHGSINCGRTREILLHPTKRPRNCWGSRSSKSRLHVKHRSSWKIDPGNILMRRWIGRRHGVTAEGNVKYLSGDDLVTVDMKTSGGIATFIYNIDDGHTVTLALSREKPAKDSAMGNLVVSIWPVLREGTPEPSDNGDGIAWRQSGSFDDLGPYTHKMQGETDTWTFDKAPLPMFTVAAERMPLGDGKTGLVDVLDVMMTKRT